MTHTNSWPDHIVDEVDCYFHDVLTPRKKMHVESHCEECESCRVALEEGRKRFEAMKNVASSEPGEALLQTAFKKIDALEDVRRQRLRLLRRATLASVFGMLLLAAGFWVYYLNLGPSPYDLRVVSPDQFASGSRASLRVRMVHHNRGQGVDKVPITVELGRPGDGSGRVNSESRFTELVHFETDEHGTGMPKFHLPDWKDGDYLLRVTAKSPGLPQVIERRVRLKHLRKLMVSSDRPVYRPGQVIHVRSLALGALDLKPVQGQDVVFRVIDPKDNVIFKHRMLSSRYGIAYADCLLAEDIVEGQYIVQCEMGAESNSLAVQVKKYVLPKFKIAVDFDKAFFEPGQRVTGKVRAEYFFGKPLAEKDGLIELELNHGLTKKGAPEYLSLPPGAKGETSFSLPPIPDWLLNGAEELTLDLGVRVTDSAGQAQARRVPILVTNQPLRIDVVPEGGTLVPGVPNQVFVRVTTADGKPVKAKVAIAELRKEVTTDELGLAQFEVTPEASSSFDLSVQARADEQSLVRRRFKLDMSAEFILRTDKAVYESGDQVGFHYLGKDDGQFVFVDILKEGQCVEHRAWLPSEAMQLQLPADWFGTFQVRAYRPENPTAPRVSFIYVRPPRQVRIVTKLDKHQYAPRSRAHLNFRLTNQDGDALAGALSLAVADESAFAVLDQAENPATLLLKNRSSSQSSEMDVSWSPEVIDIGSSKEQQQFDQANIARQFENSRSAAFFREARTYPSNLSAAAAKKGAMMQAFWSIAFFVSGLMVLAAFFGLIFVVVRWLVLSGWRSEQKAWFLVGGIVLVIFVIFVSLTGVGGDLSTRFLPTPVVKLGTDLVGGSMVLDKKAKEAGWQLAPEKKKENGSDKIDAPRIRDWFPETLLWRPEIITDELGHAQLPLDLADSITTWRLSASAVTAEGRLGASQEKIKVFQPFFVEVQLPVALTRGDEVAMPVVVYSYINQPQDVAIKLAEANWFELLDDAEKKLTLKANEVKATSFRIRVRKVGRHELTVAASGAKLADAIRREIEVVPDGRAVETVWNGVLRQPVDIALAVPGQATPDSARLTLKIYPSPFSQVVEGLDSIFRMPSGCFEQTSSSTYPNVLALDYLKRNKKQSPEVESKAKQYIHLGYQRLVGFEVKGGGFDWFGNPPANRTLTAYGLMEFTDMARVHEVDPKLIERTRAWLLGERNKQDGSWEPEGHVPANLPGGRVGGDRLARLSTTAYIAWAVFGGSGQLQEADLTRRFLLRHPAGQIDDPYVLALIANALLAMETGPAADSSAYLARLEELRKTTPDGNQVYWQQAAGERTTFYGAGTSGDVETTALAVLALMRSSRNSGLVAPALAWVGSQRDAHGTWHSTQATVLALKALLAGTDTPAGNVRRRVQLTWADGEESIIDIPAEQAEVVKQVDLTAYLKTGSNRVTISELNQTTPGYQLVLRHHEPAPRQDQGAPFVVKLRYEKDEVPVGATLPVTATVRSERAETAPMVMVEVPIPPGFDMDMESWSKLADQKRIAKFQTRPGWVLVYLRGLEPGKTLDLSYRLRARMAAKIQAPPARVYEYYNPARNAMSESAKLTVVP